MTNLQKNPHSKNAVSYNSHQLTIIPAKQGYALPLLPRQIDALNELFGTIETYNLNFGNLRALVKHLHDGYADGKIAQTPEMLSTVKTMTALCNALQPVNGMYLPGVGLTAGYNEINNSFETI